MRGPLIAAALALLVGCSPGVRTKNARAAHEQLACAACHQGDRAERGRASVPVEACAASGCHTDRGPESVQLANAVFGHRNHGASGAIRPACAGCHTHDRGEEPLRASVDTCALCHIGELSGEKPQQCQLCHRPTAHVNFTSQGVPVPHSSLPWLETGCIRCHYDVARPPVLVPNRRCAACHAQRTDQLLAAGIGTDLHPTHSGVTCTSCHETGTHRVLAMSSAVALVCADCHRLAHGLTLPDAWSDATTCAQCHRTVHAAQQRLLLGLLPGASAAPSPKFIAGITCRSCHIQGRGDPTAAIRGQAEACAGCHRTEYTQVLRWWREGLAARGRLADDYVGRAERGLAHASDSARVLLAGARGMLEVVREGGGQHNLDLSDAVFRESVRRAQEAYRASGRPPPPAPDLGTRPHAGLCSYCHYSAQELWDFDRMSAPFHEAVLGRGGPDS
ncbi:MAG: hypothetical protein HY705_02840 [Gemmatimonadetes bacterium]|nr:hypothetical protein [Gemmatimonadota bacterium]